MDKPEIFMAPGPTPVPYEVLLAQGSPLVYHRGPGYGQLLREVTESLQELMKTTSDVLVLTSSGTGGLESAVTNLALKSLFGRLRPALDPALTGPLPWGLRRPVTSAFPSGHSTAGFTTAVFLSRADPGPPWYLIAGLVGFSRVYVRLHHTSDVIGGAALGLAFGYAARRFAPPPPSVAPGNAG